MWYQKWWVHLRHRPESGGAIVHLQKTGQGRSIQGHVSDTVLNSQAVQSSFAANASYFLSQAFPEGSPTHPAYPTGHGTVAGACITALKFFFDGTSNFLREPCHAVDRRNGHRPVYGPDGRGAADGQRRTEQAGQQHQLRSRHPCRDPLAQRYRTSIQLGEASR